MKNYNVLFFLVLAMGVLLFSFFSPAFAQPPDTSTSPEATEEATNNVVIELPTNTTPTVVQEDSGWWPLIAGISVIATTVIALVSKGGDVAVQTRRLATDERLTAQLQKSIAESAPQQIVTEAHELAATFRDKWLPTIEDVSDFAYNITAPLVDPDNPPPPPHDTTFSSSKLHKE